MRTLLLATGAIVALAAEGAIETRACDTEMICAWRRTFYGPNALATPLRGYLLPRRPNWDGWGSPPANCVPACQAAFGFESGGFERLGRIPNELDLSLGTLPPKQ